jgi:hypothetical protein
MGLVPVVVPGQVALAQQANPIRILPDTVYKGETFNVTVTFTTPADNFTLISLTDVAPAGWNVTVNAAWCTPAAATVVATGNQAEIVWGGSFDNGTDFLALYKVTVPNDAELGNYNFTGFLGYYLAEPWIPSEHIFENTTGDSVIDVIGTTLEGHVSFSGVSQGPKWVRGLEVNFFNSTTGNETAWSPMNATTNNTGVFTVSGLTAGTYDIGIKNWTCLSELKTNETLTAGNTTVVDFGTTREGDANNDDYVNIADASSLASSYGSSEGGTGWNEHCDFNRDGYVNIADASALASNYGQHGDLA